MSMTHNRSTSIGSIKPGILRGVGALAALGLLAMAACDPSDPSAIPRAIEEDAREGLEDAIGIDAVDSLVDREFVESGGNGMTWAKNSHSSATGTDKVECGGCDPYTGDAVCTDVLPVLCIKNDGSPNPGIATSFYNGWASGHIGLTFPVAGTALASVATADALCETQFGPGYRMAEFHDGSGGWAWNAFGNIDDASRFWVYIDDQPGNCWD